MSDEIELHVYELYLTRDRTCTEEIVIHVRAPSEDVAKEMVSPIIDEAWEEVNDGWDEVDWSQHDEIRVLEIKEIVLSDESIDIDLARLYEPEKDR